MKTAPIIVQKKFTEGNDHNVYLVSIGKDRFVLKQYRFQSSKSVEEETRLINFLYQKRCRVPKIFPFKKFSCHLSFLWRKGPAILMEYLPGKLLSRERITLEILKQVGRELGKMDRNSFYFQSNIRKRTSLINDVFKFHPLFKHPKFRDFLKIFPGLDKTASGIGRQYKLRLETLRRLPLGIFHNDISEKNIIVDQGRLSGFIDFSDYLITAPIVNFATASAHLCFKQKNWQRNLCVFIKSYRRQFPFEYWQENIDLFVFLMKWRLLSEMATNFYLGTILKKARNTEFTNRVLWKKLRAIQSISEDKICGALKNCL